MANRKHDNDFKSMIVELVKSGRKVKELGEEYGLDESMIRRWRRQYEAKSGVFNKKQELFREELELRALRKELREVSLERDILKKAVSIFSKSDR